MKLISSTRFQISRIASPHYYFGRSIFRLLGQRCFQYIAYLRSERPLRKDLENVKNLRNSGKGRVALVLGNGPSLDNLNPQIAQELCQDIFVVNGFYNLQISKKLKPTFYCLSDKLSIKYSTKNSIDLHPNMLEYLTQNDISLVVPHIFRGIRNFASEKLYLFDDREQTLFSKNISPLKPRGYGSVTSYKALALACYMNYDTIYILGFDNTEFYEYRGTLSNTLSESYTSYAKTSLGEPFAYLGGEEEGNDLVTANSSPFICGIAGRMQSYAHLFGDLRLFQKSNILNLDPYSLTDAFPKVAKSPLVIGN